MVQFEMGHGILIEFIVNILRVVLMKQAIELFLVKRDAAGWILRSVYGIYYMATSAVYCFWGMSFLYEACNVVGILGIACCYTGMWRNRLWTIVTWFGIDLSCLSAAVFFMDSGMSGGTIYLKTVVGVLLFLISVTIAGSIGGADGFRHAQPGRKQAMLLSVTPAASILALCSMLYAKPGAGGASCLVCICLLAVNLGVFGLYHEMLKNYRHLRERDRYRQQTQLYRNQLEIIMESGSRIRSLRHDMKNHILSLQALSNNGSREEVQKYLQKMQEFMVNPSEHVMSGNEDVDSLLNYKIGRAKELLHTVETKITIPEYLNLGSFDLNVILGNLLDNALEAAVQTEEKELKIQMEENRGVLFLNVSNSCNDDVSGEKGVGKTTKEDKRNHGMGLGNVRAIVEKHHGDMEIVCEHSRFEVDIMLYMKEL